MRNLIRLSEPQLLFGHGQAMEDPRDGLALFGPFDTGTVFAIRTGVVGTRSGIERFKAWTHRIKTLVRTKNHIQARPPFPGFEAVFRIPWSDAPLLVRTIDEEELKKRLFQDDRHQRVFQTVDLFADEIIKAHNEEEAKPDLWFVVIPDDVRKYCRPLSVIEPSVRIEAKRYFAENIRDNVRKAKRLIAEPSLFKEDNKEAEPYSYKEHFRNQLKAKLLPHRISTQVVRESTVANVGPRGDSRREQSEELLQSQIAWNISTTAFYKAGARPWKVTGIREGVAYVGLVFKRYNSGGDNRSAACGAQMFLDSGDGVVFKGAVGKWYDSATEEYHLTTEAAKALMTLTVESYKAKHNQEPPKELFIHGQTRFNWREWAGFAAAVDARTSLVGVRIRDDKGLKLFRKTDNPVLRGTAYINSDQEAFLWTRGWVPRLRTYPGMEVPNPLSVEICQGNASMQTVLGDILALTKLNYNTCRYGDGKPITLKFADAVGEVLTAGEIGDTPPLPFMYYI
jgi:hypothetical protein